MTNEQRAALRKAAKEYGAPIIYAPHYISFIAGAEWMEQNQWISVSERLPEFGQYVTFVINSPHDQHRHGKVYGGRYTGHDFATTGVGYMASYWMPSPEPPKAENNE